MAGLTRLKSKFILATLSNGNVSLLVNMARFASLPWDAVLGAEPNQAYKPLPRCYLGNARYLDKEPSECMLVVAHNDDLAAARGLIPAGPFVSFFRFLVWHAGRVGSGPRFSRMERSLSSSPFRCQAHGRYR